MASLLPGNSGLFEKAFETSLAARWSMLADGVEAIRYDKLSPPPEMLPHVVWEFGLGELTPYVPNLYDLLREGLVWQRLRGTPAAMALGLGWTGHVAVIEEAWTERRWWNSYQLHFEALPLDAALESIEGIARLSTAKRSQLYRATYGYDARACELDQSQTDVCMLDQDSGLAVTDAGTIWSFGRGTEVEHILTEAEGLALGNWISSARAPVYFGAADFALETMRDDAALLWTSITIPWKDATFPWAADAISQRQSQMAAWFSARTIHIAFRDGSAELIGYRRCRIVRAVNEAFDGAYAFGAKSWSPSPAGRAVLIEAMTDFEDADGVSAASVSLVVGASMGAEIPPGRLWLQPADLSGGVEIAATPVTLPLRATVRERITFLMRF